MFSPKTANTSLENCRSSVLYESKHDGLYNSRFLEGQIVGPWDPVLVPFVFCYFIQPHVNLTARKE